MPTAWIRPILGIARTLAWTAALGCGSRAPVEHQGGGDPLEQAELEARDRYAKTPVSVSGRVLDRNGAPIPGAALELARQTSLSDEAGYYDFSGVARHNAMLTVSAPGFRVERVPLALAVPLDLAVVDVLPLLLFRDDLARLTFGGDVQLGRRYLDPTGQTPLDSVPPDDPTALLRASDPAPGTEAVLAPIRPWLSDADFTSVNLETVVTDTPSSPDLANSYVFFTLPGSLSPLRDAGVDHVANGNDHIDDYLDDGLRDTLAAVDEAGLLHSGAGIDVEGAFEAARTDIRGVPYALLSFVAIEGLAVQNATNATESHSGAADLNDGARITNALERERDAGYVPIAELHTGYEYSEAPLDDTTTGRMELVADAGAALVVCHHPHVAQGFQFHDGTLIAHSLGNLVFDQERLETELGLLLSVDLDGERLANAEARGVFIDDLVPKPITGHVHDALLRRIAGASAPWGTLVVPYGPSAWVVPAERADEIETIDRHVPASIHVQEEGFAVIDLRPVLEPGESILAVQTPQALSSLRIGRDLLVFGDMEDADVDATDLETPVWSTTGLGGTGSSYVCRKDPYRGAAALCSIQEESSTKEASIELRERLAVLGDRTHLPNQELTLLAMMSAHRAGPVRVEARYYVGLDDAEFGGETALELDGGSYTWQQEVRDLHMPPDARALRIFFHQAAPTSGSGIVRIDDVAVIAWQEELDPSGKATLDVPNVSDFIRIEAKPGAYAFDVSLRKRVPKASLVP